MSWAAELVPVLRRAGGVEECHFYREKHKLKP